MKKNFLGKKFFVITSHPDDESFLCGGTIYGNYRDFVGVLQELNPRRQITTNEYNTFYRWSRPSQGAGY